jgi:hypothetical protein
MITNTHDKHRKSKLALLPHRLVREIQQVTGGHFHALFSVVCMRCTDKSGNDGVLIQLFCVGVLWWNRVT